jgi:hypothetical protein
MGVSGDLRRGTCLAQTVPSSDCKQAQGDDLPVVKVQASYPARIGYSSGCKQLATIGLFGLPVASSLQRSDCLVFRLQAACKTGTGQSFDGKLADPEPLPGLMEQQRR